jgi:hypothetical protein
MRRGDVAGPFAVGVVAIVCCALLPSLLAFAGGLTLASLLGAGAAVALLAGATGMAVVGVRRRRRRWPRGTA